MERQDLEWWLAVRDLYQWRKAPQVKSTAAIVFNRLERGEDVPFIAHMHPNLKQAYDDWKSHGNEDSFFLLNNFRPED